MKPNLIYSEGAPTDDDVARLREFATHYAEPPELRPGDFVTPRRMSFPELNGRVFVVLEHRPDAEPLFAGGPMLAPGGLPEVRVAVVEGDVIATFWTERHALEPWAGGHEPSVVGMLAR